MSDLVDEGRFAAHGTDIGAFVTNRLCLDRPDGVVAAHLTQAAEPAPMAEGSLAADERSWIRREKSTTR